MTTPDIRLHALNWPCSVYVIINLPQHGLAVCNLIWTLTHMYVYIVTPSGYIGCYYGVLSPRPNWAKNEQCTCHRKSPNLSGLRCVLADIYCSDWRDLLTRAEFPSWSMSSAQRTKKDADIMNYV